MKKITNFICSLIFLIGISNPSFASDSVFSIPTYTLSVANIEYTSPNTIEWDVFLLHTNPTVTRFFYAAGQYFFNFNSNIANGGTLTFSSLSAQSELLPAYRPVNPSISGNILRLASNLPGSEEDSVLISSIYPGTRILKLRLRTSAPSFNTENLNLEWRSNIPDPFTRIAAFTLKNNFIVVDISTPATHFIPNPFFSQLLSPLTNFFK